MEADTNQMKPSYSELLKKYKYLRKMCVKNIATFCWYYCYYMQRVRTIYFLKIDKYELEIEARRLEIQKMKRHFVLRQIAHSCGEEVKAKEIEKQVAQEFAKVDNEYKKDVKYIHEMEKWGKKEWLSKREMHLKHRALFRIAEKVAPRLNKKVSAKGRKLWKEVFRALKEWDWARFDELCQQAKSFPRREEKFEKDAKGLSKFQKEVERLDQVYEQEHDGLLFCMCMFPLHNMIHKLENKKYIAKRQKKIFGRIAAINKIHDLYKGLVENDVDIQEGEFPSELMNVTYLMTCNLSGTTHIEGFIPIANNLQVDEHLTLKRDPTNKYDEHAIAVFTEGGERIGWVARQDNALISRLMDAGKLLYGKIKEKGELKILTGYLKLSFDVYLCDI